MNTKITKEQFMLAASAVISVIALIIAMLGGFAPSVPGDNEATARGTSNFDTLQVGAGTAANPSYSFTSDADTGLYRSSANTIGLSAGGTSVGSIGAAGLVLADGSLTVPDWARFTPQTAISVTNGAVFTPTGSYQPLTSFGNVTPTLSAAGFTAGSLLLLVNTTNTSILLPEAGNLIMAGNVTLGQYDTITFLYDGTRWIERARVNN